MKTFLILIIFIFSLCGTSIAQRKQSVKSAKDTTRAIQSKPSVRNQSTVKPVTEIPGNPSMMASAITPSIVDIEGNEYATVHMGNQIWMKENLRVTRLNDGTPVSKITDNEQWIAATVPGYCWYNNDSSSLPKHHGAIYNWNTVSTGKICPIGWHVPSIKEWDTLMVLLGGDSISGDKMKVPNAWSFAIGSQPTNSSAFSAYPAGWRQQTGLFIERNEIAAWWTSMQMGYMYAWYYSIDRQRKLCSRSYHPKFDGHSIRCVKD